MSRTARFDAGCVEYVTANYNLEISFPKDMVICDLCPFSHTENSGTRFRCTLTSEILPYHNKTTGLRCPLGIDEMYDRKELEED